jgi:hypothetical protein
MAIEDNRTGPVQPLTRTSTGATIDGAGFLVRWRLRMAERQRRVIVQWLRRTANRAGETDPMVRRREPLLHYRVAAVRTDLLEIAATLERSHDPDPACVAELHDLLANGCDSPLYNPDIHVSELRATLHYVRARL